MQNNHVTIRNVEARDLSAIKAIIEESWDCDEWIEDEETVHAAVSVYLNQVLSGSTIGKVAVMEDEVVGVIFGAVKGQEPKCRMLQGSSIEDTLTLMNASDNDRESFVVYMTKINQIYEDLLRGKEENYDGTLDFFVVSEKAQGLKIGKKLWEELATYFKAHQVSSIYVYTDTSCNFGFYDHSGFKRVATQDMTVDFDGEVEMTGVFLYDYQF